MNMGRTFIGIAIASVVLYVWGFLYWGLGPWPTMIWHQAADDVAAGEALCFEPLQAPCFPNDVSHRSRLDHLQLEPWTRHPQPTLYEEPDAVDQRL